MRESLWAIIGAGAVAIGALFFLGKYGKNRMKKQLEKLVMLADEVTSKKDIARTTMRLQALGAQINYELLEQLRKDHEHQERMRVDGKTERIAHDSKTERIESFVRQESAELRGQNAAILAALGKLVELATPREFSGARHPKTTRRRIAKPRARRKAS